MTATAARQPCRRVTWRASPHAVPLSTLAVLPLLHRTAEKHGVWVQPQGRDPHWFGAHRRRLRALLWPAGACGAGAGQTPSACKRSLCCCCSTAAGSSLQGCVQQECWACRRLCGQLATHPPTHCATHPPTLRQAGGMDAVMAGNYAQLIIFVGLSFGWVGSYLYRVATKVGAGCGTTEGAGRVRAGQSGCAGQRRCSVRTRVPARPPQHRPCRLRSTIFPLNHTPTRPPTCTAALPRSK